MNDLFDVLQDVQEKLNEKIISEYNIAYPKAILSFGYWAELNHPDFNSIISDVLINDSINLCVGYDPEKEMSFPLKNPTLYNIMIALNEYLIRTEDWHVFLEDVVKLENGDYFLVLGS